MPKRWYLGLWAVILFSGCSREPSLPAVKPTMRLTSIDFSDGRPMPRRLSAEGGNQSPQLSWSGAPSGVKSFAVIMEDPDAPGSSPFVHWILINIPATVDHLDEGSGWHGSVTGRNDSGDVGYFGPKPPSGTHHYVIRVYALDTSLDLSTGFTMPQLVQAMAGHELGMGQLTGLFTR